jgi:hypothetical protein
MAAWRWLQADIGEAISMQPARAQRRAAAAPDTPLRGSLMAWAARVRRRRTLVLARRHLIAALALAIVAELLVVALGGDRHAWWLLAPLALALVDAAIALRRPLALDSVAHMLDRCLGLRDLLVTGNAIAREQAQPLGLGALVAEEAQAAAADSFATVRLTAARGRREWSWLAAGAVVLAVLAAVPGIAHRRSARELAPPTTRAAAGNPARAHAKPTTATARGARRARAGAAPPAQLARPPLAVTPSSSREAKGSGYSPYGHGGTSLTARQLAREGIANPTAAAKALGALAVGEAGGGSAGAGASSSTHGSGANAGKGAAGAGTTTPTKQGSGSAAPGSALTPASTHGNGALAGVGTKQAGVGTGGAGTGSSPPGGSAAGSAAGSTALRSGLVPELAEGASGLPLQAGYAPGGGPRAAAGEGVSQTPNGGGSGGRSAHANGGAGASVSSNLSVIPPTSNASPTLDGEVLSSYFGTANQLTLGNW